MVEFNTPMTRVRRSEKPLTQEEQRDFASVSTHSTVNTSSNEDQQRMITFLQKALRKRQQHAVMLKKQLQARWARAGRCVTHQSCSVQSAVSKGIPFRLKELPRRTCKPCLRNQKLDQIAGKVAPVRRQQQPIKVPSRSNTCRTRRLLTKSMSKLSVTSTGSKPFFSGKCGESKNLDVSGIVSGEKYPIRTGLLRPYPHFLFLIGN